MFQKNLSKFHFNSLYLTKTQVSIHLEENNLRFICYLHKPCHPEQSLEKYFTKQHINME